MPMVFALSAFFFIFFLPTNNQKGAIDPPNGGVSQMFPDRLLATIKHGVYNN
jgi:hypothetical protein